jgi:hypothetical protein
MPASHIYKVMFVNQGKIYEVYARKVNHGSLFGFIEIEELVFGERSTVVLDPGEERIKSEFLHFVDSKDRVQAQLSALALCASNRRSEETGREQDQHLRRFERGPIPDARLSAAGG